MDWTTGMVDSLDWAFFYATALVVFVIFHHLLLSCLFIHVDVAELGSHHNSCIQCLPNAIPM